MSEKVFFQFKPENALDELIELFIQKGDWKRELRNEENYLHQYFWPEIILSDEECLINYWNEANNCIERLGEYRLRPNRGGQVVLFMPTIFSCISDYLNHNNLSEDSRNQHIVALCELVLIHEFVHWLVDVGESPSQIQLWGATQLTAEKYGMAYRKFISQLDLFKYTNVDSVSYHETFTQIFTNYFCNKIGGIHWDLFQWLEPQQPLQYTVYKDLFSGIWAGRDMIIDGVILDQRIQMIQEEQLEQVFDLLNFTRELDCQSFEVLQVLSNNYQPLDKLNKCKLFFEKIIKSTHIESNCYDNAVKLCKSLHPDLIDNNKGRITGKKYGLN
jgi:hypothetical protein